MMKQKLLFSTIIAISLLGGTQPATAGGLDNNEVVRDGRGNVVRSQAFGTCVRTKWEAGQDPCAPEPVAEAEVKPSAYVRTVLSNTEKTVYFDFNSAALTQQARQRLDGVAKILKAADDVKSADIVGYADRKGSVSYNQKLSKKRADAVKNYLAQQGYLKTRVANVRGLGETNSVTSCDTSLPRGQEIACLSPDRRVEVEIKYTDTQKVSQE